ncbi:MAG TPA: HEAT repeat domain-containing protein, partial [Thermoguttaceae bacterium]|nr:HEAT repeat domain-containing protein [Thermoguttaceae bacterium]
PAISDPNDPDFYRRNLADLTCWSKYRRRAAAVALSRAEPKELRTEIAGALESLLDDADSGIRHDAAAALGAWGRTEPLIRLLGDEDGGVREQALRSLVDSQDPRAAVAIAKMLTTDHGSVEGHLQQLGPAAEDAVLVYLDHEEPEVRKRACRVLGNIGTQKSIARLSELAGGGDLVMSQLAAAALRQIQTRAGTGRSNEIRIGPAPPRFPGP